MAFANRDVRTGRAIVPEGAPPDEGPRLTGEALWNQAKPVWRAGERLQAALAGTTDSASPYARPQTPGQAASQGWFGRRIGRWARRCRAAVSRGRMSTGRT